MKLRQLNKIDIDQNIFKLITKTNKPKHDNNNLQIDIIKQIQTQSIEIIQKMNAAKSNSNNHMNIGNGIESILNPISDNIKDLCREDELKDMNLMILRINFDKISLKGINIFSHDNDIYRQFSVKFNGMYDRTFSKQNKNGLCY